MPTVHRHVIMKPISVLLPAERNARTHSRQQIEQIAKSLKTFGFVNPVLIDSNQRIVAGHGRVEAAKKLGMNDVPTLSVAHLNKAQLRAYALADNRLAELAGWDNELLAVELGELAGLELDFDLSVTGFAHAEIDLMLQPASEAPDDADAIPLAPTQAATVTTAGDIWHLGDHLVMCADARDRSAARTLMGNERARVVFTDPPYNVPIDGHVSGLGRNRHTAFAMASGEMTSVEFTNFLETILANAVAVSAPGALHYVCMDWRHMSELLTAGERVYAELKNLCVWNKTNGGMGSLYRSKHELVFVFKHGTAAHVNNVELGRFGRYRSNVWEHAGANTWRRGRKADLEDHPTVKPVLMVADAIQDASNRGDIVLDAFGGAGTTLMAAEQTGRCARLIEISPQYVDVTITRWQAATGSHAVHVASGERFVDRTAKSGDLAKGSTKRSASQ